MDWSFFYEGPVEPTEDFHCATCLARRRAECPTHGKAFVAGCAHCIAAQGGPCQKHWGIKAAVEAHPIPADPEAAKDWEAAKAYLFASLAKAPPDAKHIVCRLRGDAMLHESGSFHFQHEFEVVVR